MASAPATTSWMNSASSQPATAMPPLPVTARVAAWPGNFSVAARISSTMVRRTSEKCRW